MASNESKQGKQPSKGSNFWLDLINAALRDVLPERLQVRVMPAKKKRGKAKKRSSGEGGTEFEFASMICLQCQRTTKYSIVRKHLKGSISTPLSPVDNSEANAKRATAFASEHHTSEMGLTVGGD